MWAFAAFTYGQANKTNVEAYGAMLVAHAAKHPTFRAITGYEAEASSAYFKVDSSLSVELRLAEPNIRFRKLEDGSFERVLDAGMEHLIGDSLVAEHAGFLRDTIARADLAQVRKGSDAALRGNDPRFFRHIMLPALISSAGIAGIISLFYIRSR